MELRKKLHPAGITNFYNFITKPKQQAMKKFLSVLPAVFFSFITHAQKTVQTLQPTKLSVFKNGTYFIKREASVELKDNVFYIPAPQNALMGTWWLAAGKETPIHSIVVKADTIKTEKQAQDLYEYLRANTGNDISLISLSQNTAAARMVTGKLLQFNPATNMVKIAQQNGNVIIANASDFGTLEASKPNSSFMADSITGTTKVTVSRPAKTVTASTISLESGIQWYASYLLTPINDKEARLEMKATLTNDNEDLRNTSVDIIIGNPEMFYGRQLDPACYNYFGERILTRAVDNNFVQYNYASNLANNTAGWSGRHSNEDDNDKDDEQKDGQKSGDLYYYQLGTLDIEKNAKVIVPVNSNTVTYSELYTVDLDENSASDDNKIAEVFHNYRIGNTTTAPFTAGSVFVLNQNGQPFSQSKMNYTPVKGDAEIRLARAIDVQAKNTEEEVKREKVFATNNYVDKITYKGSVKLTNYHTKAITIKVNKKTDGVTVEAGTNGKYKKTNNRRTYKKNGSTIEWEITLNAGESTELTYQYYSFN